MANPPSHRTPPSATPGSSAAGRRRPAVLAAVAAAALGAALAGSAPARLAFARSAAAPAPVAADSGDTLRHVRVVSSVRGKLNVRLEVVKANIPVPYGGTATQSLRAYRLTSANGVNYNDSASYPGPTFRIRRGDTVRVLLVNRLSNPNNSTCMSYPAANEGLDKFPDCFHGPDWSNIHYHGFHVTPGGTGDNVLLQIAPGDSFQYSFVVPYDQAAGTMWYHPHKHGSVAVQVNNAMAGAFIVEGGGLDSLTDRYGMRDILMAVQQVDSMLNLVDGNFGAQTLVNGQISPVVPVCPSEVARVRLVNENVSKSAQFSIFFPTGANQPKLYDIARDGIQYATANYDTVQADTALNIYPGNRLDVFVRAPSTPGDFTLNARIVARLGRSRKQLPELANVPVNARGQRSQQTVPATLARFRVKATGCTPGTYNTRLPGTLPGLPYYLRNIGRTRDTAVVAFTDTGYSTRAPIDTPAFFFLGTQQNRFMQYDPSAIYIPRTATGRYVPMILGDSQTWKIVNYGVSTNHPFHIHINPFQVVQVYAPNAGDPYRDYFAFLNQAAAKGSPIWSDVVPLPIADTTASGQVTTPGYVIIKQRYLNFTGEFVMHCHILGHEERGMMQNLKVFATSVSAAAARRGTVVHSRQARAAAMHSSMHH
jgi:FtsP/CotA-like multicopper oxidase with cupredoxin domain